VKRTYPKILRNRKQRIARRLQPRNYSDQSEPMLSARNIHYEMAQKSEAIGAGGIGAMHLMNQKLGLIEEIDSRLHLLKFHLPYHESDHVLNITYNALLGGLRLEDIELRRNDEPFLNGLGAQRIPDPTTAGDFTRRFAQEDVLTLLECINTTRQRVWAKQGAGFLKQAVLDIDGTLAPTSGECKGGMRLSYKGIWGYAPLIVTLANTREVLYLVNRPGNAVSHQGAAGWIDRAIGLVQARAEKVLLRGDTDFSLTGEFDRWSAAGVDFLFGMDAHPKLVMEAQKLAPGAWRQLLRTARSEVKTEPREKPDRVKEQVVKEQGYRNLKLKSEEIAEFEYRPRKCERSYRLVVVRKNLSVEEGEQVLFEDLRYFFYITTLRELSAQEVVESANQRCDQENVIAQLKNGVNAMRMPVDDLLSNWAYMVMASLAWNLKAWYGLLMPRKQSGLEVLRMEFRRFLHGFILIPAQIVRTGRKVIYRLLGYNRHLSDFFATFERIRRLEAT
jgi:hypothetical protein